MCNGAPPISSSRRGVRDTVQRHIQIQLSYVLAVLVAVIGLRALWLGAERVEDISYTEFEQALRDSRVATVEITGTVLRGEYRTATPEGIERFVTPRVDTELAHELAQYDVEFKGSADNTLWRDVLSWIVPALAFLAIWLFIFRRFAGREVGGALEIGKSKAKVYVETDTKVTFADVAGVDEALTELREIVEFLKDPKTLRPPRRAHAEGRPARRPARHGQDPARARRRRRGRLCRSSRSTAPSSSRCSSASARRACATCSSRRGKRAPAIIFIDELDALGRARGVAGFGGARREGADAEPAARRARRFRSARRASCCSRRRTGPKSSILRCCAPAASTARCSSTGPTRRAASRSSDRAPEEGAARADVDPEQDRGAHGGLLRRRPGQPRERSGAARDAPRRGAASPPRTSRKPSSASSRASRSVTGA